MAIEIAFGLAFAVIVRAALVPTPPLHSVRLSIGVGLSLLLPLPESPLVGEDASGSFERTSLRVELQSDSE